MERESGRLHRSLAVLAAPKRFQLLLLVLSGRDRSVSQLARAVRLSQSCTTRHLQALEAAGLVKGWRDGKRVVFRLEPRDEAAAAVIASLEAPPENEAGPLEAPVPPPRPRAKRRRPEPDPQEVRPPATEAPAREEPESGMNSAPPPAARYWSEIEDYLL